MTPKKPTWNESLADLVPLKEYVMFFLCFVEITSANITGDRLPLSKIQYQTRKRSPTEAMGSSCLSVRRI